MDMQAITEALRAKVGDSSGLNATLKFDCGADGCVYIDGKSVPNTVSNENKDADCTVAISHENLVALLTGGMRQGASTITQQVAKSMLLTPEKKFSRKLKEAILAKHSPAEVLTMKPEDGLPLMKECAAKSGLTM